MDIKNRTSRGYIEEAEIIAFNLQSVADHLGDLKDNELLEVIEEIKEANIARQEVLASIGLEIDHHYHCAYKHTLMARGQLLELIQATKRNDDDERLAKLLNVYERINRLLQVIRGRYFQIDKGVDMDCARCLDDLLKTDT